MASSPTIERTIAPDGALKQQGRAARAGLIPLLALVYTLGLALFIGTDPTRPWILLVTAALVGLGTDGILRAHPLGAFSTVADTAPYMFVPVLFTLASGLFLEDAALGYWQAPAIAGSGVLMAMAIYAEHLSVDTAHRRFHQARFALNVVTYLAAFAFYAVVYGFDVELAPAACAVGLVSMLLAIEIFREAEADPIRALVFAAVIGVIVGEARWVLYFIPLDGFLAAVFMLLAFYLTTGIIAHYLTDHLDTTVLAEFALVSAAGLGIVIGGRVFG